MTVLLDRYAARQLPTDCDLLTVASQYYGAHGELLLARHHGSLGDSEPHKMRPMLQIMDREDADPEPFFA